MKSALKSLAKASWAKVETLFSHLDYIPKGFSVAGVHAGLKTWPRKDIALIRSDVDAVAAATMTTNSCPGAPIIVSREVLAQHANRITTIVVNSACANSATGAEGVEDAREMSELAKRLTNSPAPALVMSTGMIGWKLPIDKVLVGIREAAEKLGSTEQHFFDAANGIRLEDTKPKLRSHQVHFRDGTATLLAMSKGAGMIHPNMATTLTIAMTDANISRECLQKAWSHAIKRTINHISIDGDMSTNDSAFILANGLAGNSKITDPESEEFTAFQTGLLELMMEIAKGLVRDGGGATKFVTVIVRGAKNDDEALRAARKIASSEQVKAPLSGNKGNWGAVVASVGACGVSVNPDKMSVWLHKGSEQDEGRETVNLLQSGKLIPVSVERERDVLNQEDLTIEIDLGVESENGQQGFSYVWTTDLTVEYVAENA